MAQRARLLPLAVLQAGATVAVVCAVWAYAIQPDIPVPRTEVPLMDFVVPSQSDQPLVNRAHAIPAVQQETPGSDIIKDCPIEG
jgi:hypothetical protein